MRTDAIERPTRCVSQSLNSTLPRDARYLLGQLDNQGADHACQIAAVDLVLDWQREMMWAALEGSALGGRPLRMVTTGLRGSQVRDGYDAGNAQDPLEEDDYIDYYVTDEVIEWANADQLYTAVHVHYMNVAQGLETIQKLVDTYDGEGSPWDVPDWRIATEMGTTADFLTDDWWSTEVEPFGVSNVEIHQMFFWGSTNPPTGESWEDFIDRWESEADSWNPSGEDPGFRVDDLFAELAGSDFVGLCWSTHQWDKGTVPFPSRYLVEGLRADQVRDDEDLFEYGNDEIRFTPIKDAYVTAGTQYKIANFAPHTYDCDESVVCPECGN